MLCYAWFEWSFDNSAHIRFNGKITYGMHTSVTTLYRPKSQTSFLALFLWDVLFCCPCCHCIIDQSMSCDGDAECKDDAGFKTRMVEGILMDFDCNQFHRKNELKYTMYIWMPYTDYVDLIVEDIPIAVRKKETWHLINSTCSYANPQWLAKSPLCVHSSRIKGPVLKYQCLALAYCRQGKIV